LTDAPARPAANENHLLISAYTTHPQSPLLAVTRRISDSGCNMVDARLSTVGSRRLGHGAGGRLLGRGGQARGDAGAAGARGRLQAGLVPHRPKPVQSNLLPYIVEVVAADKPGILFQLADFFDKQGITIESLHSSRYRAMQTGAEMFTSQVTIGFRPTCTSPRCATTSWNSATTSTSTRSWIR
jgi:glycine cleavage system transcriptional repressor